MNTKKQIWVMSILWAVLVISVAASQWKNIPIDECTFMAQPFHDACLNIQGYKKFHKIPGTAYDQPELRDFPNIAIKDQTALPVGFAVVSPDLIQFTEYDVETRQRNNVGLAIAVEQDEFGWTREDAYWAQAAFDFACDGIPFQAIKLHTQNNLIDRITFAYYETPENEAITLFTKTKLYWESYISNNNDPFRASLEKHNIQAMHELDTEDAWGRPVYRVAIRNIEEHPHSLTNDTGVPLIMTYGIRNDMVNRDHEVEYYTYDRVILMPYRRGTLKLVATTTSLGGQTPSLAPWQDVWKSVRFENGIPDNSKPFVAEDGRTEPQLPLNFHYKHQLGCTGAGRLPPRWAWPKYAPKYQLPFWPYWTFG